MMHKIQYSPNLDKSEFFVQKGKNADQNLPDLEELTKIGEIPHPTQLSDSRLKEFTSLQEIFGNPLTVGYKDVLSTQWQHEWPATQAGIKTALYALEQIPNGIESAIDIGCGTGMIGQIMAKYSGAKRVDFMDIQKGAIVDALHNLFIQTGIEPIVNNAEIIFKDEDHLYKILPSGKVSALENKTYDLMVSNPPYFPIPDSWKEEIRCHSGTKLLQSIITEGKEKTTENGKVIMCYPHITDYEVENALAEVGGKITHQKTIKKPFNFKSVVDNEEWINFLIKDRGLIVKPNGSYEQNFHYSTIEYN